MDTCAKLYDSVLNNRLQKWWTPDREQAGAQQGRGCQEHIVTLRLLMDYALSKKKKLFVDFSKASDRVPRAGLLRLLKQLGYGVAMLSAIATTCANTSMILKDAVILTPIGVRQGSPTPVPIVHPICQRPYS